MDVIKIVTDNDQIKEAQKNLENTVQEKMLWIFDQAIQNRKDYYSQNPDETPNLEALNEHAQ